MYRLPSANVSVSPFTSGSHVYSRRMLSFTKTGDAEYRRVLISAWSNSMLTDTLMPSFEMRRSVI